MNEPLEQMKETARATWATGNYSAVAEHTIWGVGESLVERMVIQEGEEVLDVACGTGNAAIRAAQAGAKVTGVDLTPELFDRGRELAAEAGVAIEWVEGDAEALPFDGESFDVALSVFGCMFAPRHDLAARELARVTRPGGRMGVVAWTPEGMIGRFFRTVGSYMPPPPDFAQPPPLWGDEAHVRELFEGTGMTVSFERGAVDFGELFEGPEQELDFYIEHFGPLIRAKQATEADGRWPELREELLEVYEDHNAEYLVTLGQKQA